MRNPSYFRWQTRKRVLARLFHLLYMKPFVEIFLWYKTSCEFFLTREQSLSGYNNRTTVNYGFRGHSLGLLFVARQIIKVYECCVLISQYRKLNSPLRKKLHAGKTEKWTNRKRSSPSLGHTNVSWAPALPRDWQDSTFCSWSCVNWTTWHFYFKTENIFEFEFGSPRNVL